MATVKKSTRSLPLLFLILCATPLAQAVNIDMEGTAESGSKTDDLLGSVRIFGDAVLFTGHGHFWSATHPLIGSDRPDNGSDFLLNDAASGITIAALSGTFSLTQFDASEWDVHLPREQTITVTGTLPGGETIVANFVTDALFAFETFVLPAGFDELDSVNIKNENGDMAWDNILINEEPPQPTPRAPSVTGVLLAGTDFTIRFQAEAGLRDWRVMGSSDVRDFSHNISARSTISEIAPGQYEAVVDVSGMPGSFFLRVER